MFFIATAGRRAGRLRLGTRKFVATSEPVPLQLRPPLPPMEARSVDEIPVGAEWQYEPKWDGFRCLVFRDGDKVELQSKSGQPLTRYFPEIVEAARQLEAKRHGPECESVVTDAR